MKTIKEQVVIECFGAREYYLYNNAGQCIEADFKSKKDAITWANDNNYKVVELFNTNNLIN